MAIRFIAKVTEPFLRGQVPAYTGASLGDEVLWPHQPQKSLGSILYKAYKDAYTRFGRIRRLRV